MFLKLLIINLVVILAIDLSGFVPHLKRQLSKWLTKDKFTTDDFRIRPFDCSYCMTFWSLLLYLVITQQVTFFSIFLVVMLTHLTEVTKQVLLLIRDLLIKLIDIVYEKVIDKNRN